MIGNAVRVVKLATSEEPEKLVPVSAGAALGKLGGAARAKKLIAGERHLIAQKAARASWPEKAYFLQSLKRGHREVGL